MGLYKPRFKRPDGTAYVGRNYCYTFLDPETGRRVKGSTHTPDKASAKMIFAEAQRRAAKLHSGLGNPYERHHKRPLSEHLAEWKAGLLAKGNLARQVRTNRFRVKAILDGCGFVFWPDISALRVQTLIGNELRIGAEGHRRRPNALTRNHYVRAIKQFCRWMVADRRAAESPVSHLSMENTRADRRHERRALERPRVAMLLSETNAGPERYGMSGPERAIVYQLATESGLRLGEIISLTPVSFDLDGNPPTVTVKAAYAKNRREDTLPLTSRLAAILRRWRAQRLSVRDDATAFNLPRRRPSIVEMLRADLAAAGIDYCDADGRYVDFHALRHSFGSALSRAGVAPKVAQDLMRHADIRLTMNLYTHTVLADRASAVEALPDINTGDQAGADTA